MSYTQRWSEDNAILERMEPGGYNGTYNTAYVSVKDYHRVTVVLECGTLGGAVNMQLYQATDTAGTGAKIIAGKAITELTAADDNAIVIVELRTEELDVDNGFDCVMASIVPFGMNYMSALVIGHQSRFKPVPATGIDEIVD